MDLEGVNLSRHGEICVLQITTGRLSPVYLFDICSLREAFAARDASSLKHLLEDAGIAKLMFDCRSDGNALFFLHNVRLQNVVDLQLLDVAHRKLMGIFCERINGLLASKSTCR